MTTSTSTGVSTSTGMSTGAVGAAVPAAAPRGYGTVAAEPYPWPYDGALRPANTALLCIDWQTDFCGPGGYVDTMGYDLALTRAPLIPTAKVLKAARAAGFTVVHTREGHRADLADCP